MPRLPRPALVAALVAALAAAPLAAASAGGAPPTPPDPGHQLTRLQLDEVARDLGPAGVLALSAIERHAREQAARAERDGVITPAQRAALERCIERGACGGADAERGLDAVVDRMVTGLVESTIEPALEAVLGN